MSDPVRWAIVGGVVALALVVWFARGLRRANRTLNWILAEIDAMDDDIDSVVDDVARVAARPTSGPLTMPLTIAKIESPMEHLFSTDPASTGGLPVIEGEFTPDPNPPTVMLPPQVKVTTPEPAPSTTVLPSASVKPSPRPRSSSDLVRRYWAEHEKAKGE